MLGSLSLVMLGLLLGQPASAPAQSASAPAMPRVVVVPIGKVPADLTEFIVESVRQRFYFEVASEPGVDPAAAAWYPPRKRWRAEKLLDQLDGLDVGEAIRVIGLTEQPISTTKGKIFDWGIAGLGQLPGKSCVLTAYLFRGLKTRDRAHYLRYLENLVLHELGHTLGVDHCPLDRCIMADAKGNALRAARASINEYCPRCHTLLRQWLRSKEVRGNWKGSELLQLTKPYAPTRW